MTEDVIQWRCRRDGYEHTTCSHDPATWRLNGDKVWCDACGRFPPISFGCGCHKETTWLGEFLGVRTSKDCPIHGSNPGPVVRALRRLFCVESASASLQAIVNDAAAKVAPDLTPPTATWKSNTPLRDLLNNAELPAPREMPEHIHRMFFGPRQETADLRITGALDTRGSLTIGPLTVFDDGMLRIAEGVEPCDVMRLMKRAIEEVTETAKKDARR